MIGMLVFKLISELPNMSCHIFDSKRWITLWTVHWNLFRCKHVNICAVIDSRAWSWHPSKVSWVFYFISPWINSLVWSLCSILPFIWVRKSFGVVSTISLCFLNGNWCNRDILGSIWIWINTIIWNGPSSQEVVWVLRFIPSLVEESWKVKSWN